MLLCHNVFEHGKKTDARIKQSFSINKSAVTAVLYFSPFAFRLPLTDCPYGDKLSWCTSTLTPSMCYEFEDQCCQTCDYMIKQHLDQGM